jgi:DNA-binding transcriptional regulator YiaG
VRRHSEVYARPQRAKLTAAEFRDALKEIGLSENEFANLLGKQASRVVGWAEGEDNVPHDIGLILALLELPGGVERMRAYVSLMLDRGARQSVLSAAE